MFQINLSFFLVFQILIRLYQIIINIIIYMNDLQVLQEKKNTENQILNKNVETLLVKNKSSNSDSERNSDKKVVDMMKLIKRNQRSRVSQIDIFQVQYGLRDKTKYLGNQRPHQSNYNLQQNLINHEINRQSILPNQQQNPIMKFDESFLSRNQNNGVIGAILYVLFIILITIQVIGTTYFIHKQSEKYYFYFENALLTILSSQLIFYLIARYINTLSSNRFFMNSSPVTSYKKLMFSKYYENVKIQRSFLHNWIFSKPYLILTLFASSIIICQFIYSWLTASSHYLLSYKSETYLISSIFWSYFALPFLFTNFYYKRPIQAQNLKIKIFPFLIIAYMLYSLMQGYLFILLIIFRLIHNFIQQKQEIDAFHIDQLCKAAFLILIFIMTLIKYFKQEELSQQILYFCLKLVWHIIMLTSAMVISRIIASKYIKQQLYKHYYTEMHINMAYIYATLMLVLTYFYLIENLHHQMMIQIMCTIIFVSLFGSIVYLDGREKMIITMQINLEEEKN